MLNNSRFVACLIVVSALTGSALAQETKVPSAKASVAAYLLDTDPVSGEKLGDKPIAIQVDGREFRFASQANADAFKADPAKYRGAVDEKLIKQQLSLYPLETCPVSGEKLGGMGKPVDIIAGNRLVRFCCGGCKPKFAKDSAAFLAKLDEAVIAKQKSTYPVDTCVVSGEKLGEMGSPVEVVVGSRLIRLCCKDCIAKLNAKPLEFLAKLDKATKAK